MSEFRTINEKRVELGSKSFFIREVMITKNGVEENRFLQISKKRVDDSTIHDEGSIGIEPKYPGRVKELGEPLIELAEEWEGMDLMMEDTGKLPY